MTFAGCVDALTAEMVDDRLVSGARHVHVSSFYLQARLAAGLRGLFEAARAAGAGTSLDLNWDPAEGWDGGLSEVLPVVDVLFVNAGVGGFAAVVIAAAAWVVHDHVEEAITFAGFAGRGHAEGDFEH